MPFGILAAASVLTLLWLGRDLSFLQDDCDFIRHPFTFGTILDPHNEHLHLLPLIVWRTVQALVGVGSYLPFLAVLALVNVALAAGVFKLLGGIAGLAAATLVLFLGSGGYNLLWAFQTGFVGSAALGIWAFIALRGGRPALAAMLLVGAVVSSGMGIPFLVAAIVYRPSWWLAVPAVVFTAWFATLGRLGLASGTSPLEHVDRVPRLLLSHSVDALASLSGLGPLAAIIVAVAAVSGLVVGWRPPRVLVSALIGIAAEFAMIGLVRDSGWANRYQTTFVVLGIVGLGGVPLERWKWLMIAVWMLLLIVNVQALVAAPGAISDFAALGYGCDPTAGSLSWR